MSRSKRDAIEREISDLEKKIAERKALVAKYIGYVLDLLKERFKTTEYTEFSDHVRIKKECRDFPEFDFYLSADYNWSEIKINFRRDSCFSFVFAVSWQGNSKVDAKVSVFSPDTDWQNALEKLFRNKANILKEMEEKQTKEERDRAERNRNRLRLEDLKKQASQLGL